MEKATLLNFFSAYAQSVAALVGLSAAFAIFRYQSLRMYFSEKVEKIYRAFDGQYRHFLTEAQFEKFKDFVNHEQRATYLEPIYREWLQPHRKEVIAEKLKNEHALIHEFEAWMHEFNDYTSVKHRTNSFRQKFLASTVVGLACVAIGLLAIIGLDFNSQIVADNLTVICGVLLFVYLISLYRLLSVSFQKAE